MNVSIFIRVWSKDGPWPHYCLESIRKFATGFHEIVLVAESAEASAFQDLAKEYGAVVRSYASPKKFYHSWQGYLSAQVASLEADLLVSPESDIVFTVDTDCIFTEPVTPQDYFVDGKPVLLIQSYKNVGGAQCWKEPTEKFTKLPMAYETMRRMPGVHWKGLYAVTRRQVLRQHHVPDEPGSLQHFVLACFPPTRWMADFNILGSVLMHTGWKDRYEIVNLDTTPCPPNKLRQFWSHSGVSNPQPHPNDHVVPIQVINQLGIY